MTTHDDTRLMYLLFMTSIWFIYFAAIFGLSLLFTTIHHAIMIGGLSASILLLLFIAIQRVLDGLNRMQ